MIFTRNEHAANKFLRKWPKLRNENPIRMAIGYGVKTLRKLNCLTERVMKFEKIFDVLIMIFVRNKNDYQV